MATLDQEYKKAVKEHDEKMLAIKMKHNNAKADWARREKDLKKQLHDVESDDIQLTKDLRTQVSDRDATISTLREEVTKYANQAAELTVAMAKVKAEGESREKYRLDEIDDLRVLNDAQETEIRGLKQKTAELTEELQTLKESRHEKDNGRIKDLETELQDSRDAFETLERDTKTKITTSEKTIENLRQEIDHLTADLQEEKEMAKMAMEKKSRRIKEDESRSAKRLREVVENAAKEQADLESQFEAQMEAKMMEVAELKKKVEDMQGV